MILIIIGLMILAYSFYDFKKAYYAYIVYSIFWAPQALCFTIAGKDVIMNMIMSSGLLISFLFNLKKLNVTKKIMPFTTPFILIIVSMFLSCFFAKAGFQSEITRFVSRSVQIYIPFFISWYIFETKEDYVKLIKMVIITFFLAGIYGIIEFVVQGNVFVDYKRAISTDMIVSYKTQSRGYRIISLFDNSGGAGLNFALICAFILYLYIYEKDNLPFKRFSLLTAVLCCVCVFLTKMRGNYLYLLILLIPCLNPKKINIKKVLLVALLTIIILLPFTYKRLNIIASVFDKNAQAQIKGSTIEMRLDQLDAINETINDSLIFGSGEKYSDYITTEMKERIKGPEGIWLDQLLKHGLFGVFVHIIFAIYSIILIPYKYKSNKLLFFGLAYWITYTFTTFLGFRFDLYYCILFYYIKTSKIYIENSQCASINKKHCEV